jgi:hypothetical protein
MLGGKPDPGSLYQHGVKTLAQPQILQTLLARKLTYGLAVSTNASDTILCALEVF